MVGPLVPLPWKVIGYNLKSWDNDWAYHKSEGLNIYRNFFFQEDAQEGDQTDLPPPPPEVKQSFSDQQQHRSNIYPETLKRRSMVQSLPSDYSDVQPRSYDPEFISDISNKMQVPDTISMMGHGEKSGSQMGWQEPMQRNEMRVPDRIMVAGWYFVYFAFNACLLGKGDEIFKSHLYIKIDWINLKIIWHKWSLDD